VSDKDSAVAFCAEEFPRLVRGLTFYVGSQALAEELAQEALLRACARWERVGGLDSPGAWCRRVAMNLANSHLRRRRLEQRTLQRLAERTIDESTDPTTAIVVHQAVATLPVRQRKAVILRFLYDLPVDATAAEMDVSVDAVKSLTKRAVARLRQQLGDSQLSPLRQEADDV
jgi:RNA polymerase sigma factor (sigma-70 family)